MEKLWILQFSGTGRGFMSGVTEYLTVLDNEPIEDDKEPSPGFKLDQIVEVEVVKGKGWQLPTNRILKAFV